jgi:hypothetical protein
MNLQLVACSSTASCAHVQCFNNVNTKSSLSSTLAEETHFHHLVSKVKWLNLLRDRESLVTYLTQTYYYVMASVPLMEFAVDTQFSKSNDKFRNYLLTHIKEEMHHDRWLLEDLKLLRVKENDLRSRPVIPPVGKMAGYAYYTIAHRHPIGLLGYIYALEAAPPTNEVLRRISETCGVPLAALRTLQEHGENDLAHRAELFAFIDSLEMSSWQQNIVVDTAVSTLCSCIELFDVLAEMGKRKK